MNKIYTSPNQGFIALMILGLLGACIVVAVGLPTWMHFASKLDALQSAKERLERWQGIAASGPQVEQAAEIAANNRTLRDGAISVSSDGQADARLQALLRRTLESANMEVRTLQLTSLEEGSPLRVATVRAVAVGSAEQINNAIEALERTRPRLFVEEAIIKQTGSNRRSGSASTMPLEMRLEARAFILGE